MLTVPDWSLHKDATLGDSIQRTFTFPDFQSAFFFMTQGAQLAETNYVRVLPSALGSFVRLNVVL